MKMISDVINRRIGWEGKDTQKYEQIVETYFSAMCAIPLSNHCRWFNERMCIDFTRPKLDQKRNNPRTHKNNKKAILTHSSQN